MKQIFASIGLAAAIAMPVTAHVAAATVNVAITGSAQCEHGKPVAGIWVDSSLGGGGWAGRMQGHDSTVDYFRYPAGHGTVTLTVGTYISIHVGCGMTGSKWASDNWTAGVVVHHPGHLILNAYSCVPPTWINGQTVRGTCDLPPQGQVGSSSVNPFGTPVSGAKGYCTCGASYLWYKNTGWYPKWSGDAINWAENAQHSGWTLFHYPVEHALIVWPQTATYRGRDHVGFVTGINTLTSELTFIDMNGGNHADSQLRTELFGKYDSKICSLTQANCTSARLGTVGNYLAGAQYIAANPGYDWSWGTASYPGTSAECKP